MSNEQELCKIPLSKLKPSPKNVRKTGGQSITELAASIEANGLIHNLTVEEVGKGYEVVAGGRRLAALKQLAKEKKIPANYEVACLVIDAANSAEISLAENTIREAMHPADQFEAFRQLIENGKTIADTAAAFGVTETVVKQRLKLANVSPKLLVEYRAGNATLEQMQALAISDDHAAQEAAWRDEDGWHRNPHHLRSALTETEVSSTNHRAVFVGLDAYQAAGGIVRRDLFGTEAYLADEALLNKLVIEKLEDVAEELRTEGWDWVECRPSLNWNERQKFASAGSPKRRKFTEDEQARYGVLKARNEELDDLIYGDDAPEDTSELATEQEAVQAQMEAMESARDEWPAKIKAASGVLVFLASDGINIERGVLKPGERLGKGKDGDSDPVVEDPKPKKDPAAPSQAQLERLWGERTAIIRGNISRHTSLAALAAEMWNSGSTDVQIGPKHTYFSPESRDALEKHPASLEIENTRERWQEVLEPAGDDVFGWLRGQPLETSIDLISFCVTENIISTAGGDEFARKVGINIADHWQVTEEWLAAQPKGYILAALDEVGVSNLPFLTKLKTAELAAEAVTPLKNAGWLPKPLRAEGGE